ncbi:Mrr restriction system protein [Tautonia plasticadhaerens]|uniref:Mrr restriction system protein n=1 Tax=Tautonia plasticadhaerens TaxID=2527974 RepID=A0A518H492_9BACT|nr:Mrr restriction system protein [Tautonia plasticadhaerens]
MAIPDFQAVMLTLVEALADGREWRMRDLTDRLADRFGLTEPERQELLPSGQQAIFANRVAWAKSHLKYAGLLENPTRGRVRISDLGRTVLAEEPGAINVKFLKRFPAYCEFIGKAEPPGGAESAAGSATVVEEEERTPLELIDAAYKSLRQATLEELLARLRQCSPAFFESVVVRLLMAMGYGGVAGHGTVAGRSGDGGIDGVIRQDKLGLDVVCIQAKRWDGPVGRPIVQGFVGSGLHPGPEGGHHDYLGLHQGRRGLRGPHRGQEGGADRRRLAGGTDDRARAQRGDDQDL